jgi:two-component system sensor histidine kinase BaeS
MTRIGSRIALAAIAVAFVALALVAVGVLVLASDAFERLMVEHGETAANARQMFDETVSLFFVAAAGFAVVASIGLAWVMGRHVSRPLAEVAEAARAVAHGELGVRVAPHGPAEIASLADSFNRMADRLAEQERLRSEFIANAAHELRTPLTNLKGYLEALRDGVAPATPEMLGSLHEEVDRLVRLSASLDELAKGHIDLGPPELADVDVRAAIETAAELVLPALEQRGVELSLALPERLDARANRDHVAQVLSNLLQNAARYTPAGGRVAIAAETRPDRVVVSVTNTGDGIPSADLAHIFERFYRVEKSRDRTRGGAGIGLAIVKQLVELGGGQVGAGSSDGTTRVWFSLPRARA